MAATPRLEERLKEAEQVKKKLELMGAFLGAGDYLKKPATGRTAYTASVSYLEAIVQYANKEKEKAGKNPFDPFYTFDARGFVAVSQEKFKKYTVKDYVSATKVAGLNLSNEEKTLLKKYEKREYEDLIIELSRKYQDKQREKGKMSNAEENLLHLLSEMKENITKYLEAEVSKYAQGMHETNRKLFNKLELDAQKDPKGLKGDAAKKLKSVAESLGKDEEKYKAGMKDAGATDYRALLQ